MSSDLVPVTAKVTVSYKPFQTPNYARMEGTAFDTHGTLISDLPAEALNALAERWIADLYTKAGKPNPFRRAVFRDHDGRGPG